MVPGDYSAIIPCPDCGSARTEPLSERIEAFRRLEEEVDTAIYGEDGEGYPQAEHKERMRQVADAARALVADAPIRDEPFEGSADYWEHKAQYWEALQAMIGEWGPE